MRKSVFPDLIGLLQIFCHFFPLKQYVHTLHGSSPMASSMSSSRWKRRLVKFWRLRISSTSLSYFSLVGSAYSSKTSCVASPSHSAMMRRVIKSKSDLEREKFKYLQPNNNGGQAM